ncbi:major facilitator superfamily MFS-1 [Fusarium austroafricanum]|uniref:Major facilitator superfamily MFS-1 n=1 Tax=Fusarium austroafricanum TaxID=2364996 RepID=A0A8H4KB51_9HYPO|nr:major facilitator superfamily MFS-1 [Fusarium austroafricanum]
MKPTFHLAPRLTIKPPPDGPLHLGTIVDNLTDVEPINETCRLPLPGKEYKHTAEGFMATKSQLQTGRFGVWAKFVIQGLGGEVSVSGERSAEDTYRIEKLEETTFTATQEYISKSMNERMVKDFVEGGGWDPVYMITGLKIARGPAVSKKRGKSSAFKANLGLTQPGGIEGLEIGPNIEHESQSSESVEFEKSDDFIYGIRVKRLSFKRGLFSKKSGIVVGKHYHSGANLVDNGEVIAEKDQDEAEAEDEFDDQDDELEDKVKVTVGEEVWVVPQSA